MRPLPLALLPAAALGHGVMYEPPNRASRGSNFQAPSCGGMSCLWMTQGCEIGCPRAAGSDCKVVGIGNMTKCCEHPAEPTIGKDPSLRTYNVKGDSPDGDWTKLHPWRKPGSSPVEDPCGLAGGWYSKGKIGNGGDHPPGAKQGDRGSKLPKLLKQTVWVAGSTAEVGWAIMANHGGGYQYRLCPADSELTEACFQKMPLDFVGSTQWIQFGFDGMDVNNRTEIPADSVSVGTVPAGSTWRRNPIPPCDDPFAGGAFNEPCIGHQFPPKVDGLFGFGTGACFSSLVPCTKGQILKKSHVSQSGIVDKIAVPDIPAGEYVISFRWDSEQTPQVWNTCGDVTIIEAGEPSAPFTKGNGCDLCCAESGGLCANCTACVNDKTGDCAYCWEKAKGYLVSELSITCLGHEDPVTGGAPQWWPGDPYTDFLKGWSPGCPKCWAGKDSCKRGPTPPRPPSPGSATYLCIGGVCVQGAGGIAKVMCTANCGSA